MYCRFTKIDDGRRMDELFYPTRFPKASAGIARLVGSGVVNFRAAMGMWHSAGLQPLQNGHWMVL